MWRFIVCLYCFGFLVTQLTAAENAQLVWGPPTENYTMSITIGTPIDITAKSTDIPVTITLPGVTPKPVRQYFVDLYIKNSGTETGNHSDRLSRIRPVLYDVHDQPVPMTAEGEKLADEFLRPRAQNEVECGVLPELKPGEIVGPFPIDLNYWFKVEQPGEYHLIVLRELVPYGPQILISNLLGVEYKQADIPVR